MSLGPLMIDLLGTSVTPEERELMRHPLVGGVILFTRNYVDPEQLTQLVAAIHAERRPPLIVAVDHEGGRVQRFRTGFSVLPPARRIGKEFNQDPRAGLQLARHMGWLMAAELRAHGIDISFARCVDLDYGVSESIGDRSFHARSDVVGQLAVAYMRGMREAGMAATAKHFPGHGAVVADSHLALPVDRRELSDTDQDLLPYRRLIDNGLAAVMVAHVQFPALDPLPASFSRRWISGVLRGQLNFQGLVIADDLKMAAASAAGGLVERAERALGAGCDVLLACNDRPGAEQLVQELQVKPDPVAQLRLVRMRGHKHAGFENLAASPAWQSAREWLHKSAVPPALEFPSGSAAPGER